MRTHILGTGLTLGLAITVFGGPVAWAGNAEGPQEPRNNAVTPFPHAPGEPLAAGQEIHIQGYCPDPEAGPLTSDALTGIEVLRDPQSGPPNLNRVHPDAAHPADPVAAQAACDADEATLSSPVLPTGTLPGGHQPWALHGSTAVDEDAGPGDYPVTARCAGDVLETTITVLDPPTDDPAQAGTGTGDGGGQVSRVPREAPETGDGAERTGSGPQLSLSTLLLGLTVGAAAGVGAIVWREARR